MPAAPVCGGAGRAVQVGPALVIVSATCAGERLRSLRVVSRDRATDRGVVVWAVTGDTVVPSELTVGVAPDGLTTTTSLASLPGGAIDVELATSKLHNLNLVHVALADLDDGRVHSRIGTFGDPEVFRRAALSKLPCDDPYGDRQQGRIVAGILGFGALCGLGSLVVDFGVPARGEPAVAACVAHTTLAGS